MLFTGDAGPASVCTADRTGTGTPSPMSGVLPAWEDAIHKACRFVAQELGITAPITAELYKMLIYEEGAMFKPHTEYPAPRPRPRPPRHTDPPSPSSSEKTPGMFGTLIICLPSAHQGGGLVLRHAGETKIFPTSATPVRPSQCRPTMAWHAGTRTCTTRSAPSRPATAGCSRTTSPSRPI